MRGGVESEGERKKREKRRERGMQSAYKEQNSRFRIPLLLFIQKDVHSLYLFWHHYHSYCGKIQFSLKYGK